MFLSVLPPSVDRATVALGEGRRNNMPRLPFDLGPIDHVAEAVAPLALRVPLGLSVR